MEDFEGEGVFWLEASEEHKVAGILRFTEADGATLDLIGALSPDMTNLGQEPGRSRILGVAGKRVITLLDALRSNWSLQAPGIIREQWRPSIMITGGHVTSAMPLEFTKVSVKLGNLTAWIARSGVTFSMESPETGPPTRLSFELVPPATQEAVLADGSALAVGFTWSTGGDHLHESYIRQGAYVSVGWTAARPAEEAYAVALALRDLVSVATHTACAIEELTVHHADFWRETPEGLRPEPLTVFARFGDAVEPVKRQHWDLLFTYEQLGGVEGLARWLDAASVLRPVLGTLMTIRYASSIYAENRMQNVAHAAETFHRLRFDNQVIPVDDHEARLARIFGSLEAEDGKWLRQRLQYSNEPNLRRRLRELADFAGDAFTEFVGDPKRWSHVVSTARNRLTHYQGEEPRVEGLHFLSESLYLLVLLCILHAAGADDDLLRGVTVNRHIAWLKNPLAQTLAANAS